VVNQGLKRIYEQVSEEVTPCLKNQERGLLYKAIQIILMEEDTESQEETKRICDPLGITPSANKDEDYKIVQDLVEAVYIDRQPLAKKNPMAQKISNFAMDVGKMLASDKNVEWIITTAAILVGVYFCYRFLDAPKKGNRDRSPGMRQSNNLPLPLAPPVPAILCLVVPASVVSQLANRGDLRVDEVVYLIDNASYFLCSDRVQANRHEQRLEILPDRVISPESRQDVYIRIGINGSRKLIGTKLRYKLKENLLDQSSYTIARYECLRNLSGLEDFNRI